MARWVALAAAASVERAVRFTIFSSTLFWILYFHTIKYLLFRLSNFISQCGPDLDSSSVLCTVMSSEPDSVLLQ